MKAVLYTTDLEPITILDIPLWAMERMREGDRYRLATNTPIVVNHPTDIKTASALDHLAYKIVSIWAEPICRGNNRGLLLFTDNEVDALALSASWLPGQQRMVNDHKKQVNALVELLCMALMLLQQNATVTVCHSATANLKSHTLQADLIVAAVGKRNVLTADMVKPGAVVIDVGMNRNDAGKLCGDVDFEGVSQVASYITPVPGGVGPMTITMLLVNTLEAAERVAPQ
jgi:hypothetical protein